MTNYANAEVVRVSVENFPTPARKDRSTTLKTFPLAAGTPVMILGHAPNRRRAVLTIVGLNTDVVYVCASPADAQKNEGAAFNGVSAPIILTGADEFWVVSATAPLVGVIAEYAAPGC